MSNSRERYRIDFENNYNNLDYLLDLANKVSVFYSKEVNQENYNLLDNIDNRILEIQDGR
jgi:hypothetical protein|tara:strand:+ start:303 stop:482 length:180 start_codon:yes stop_codon:yes gene_type:complete